jgi:hemerythrin-like domain-containing protein
MPAAIRIIQKEHRRITAVVEGLAHLGREIDAGRTTPDSRLLRAMIDYIDAYPERLHHPKEDRYLFRLISQRSAEPAAEIAALEDEHRASYPALERLKAALVDLEQRKEGAAKRFAAMTATYAAFHWRHMRKEEEAILPLAKRVLAAADWNEIDAAFQESVELAESGENGRKMRALFREIAHLMPAPRGLGTSASSRRS